MNFDEIVVKESPGICRCCLSEGCYKDLGADYTWMNETEVYADMLLDCFDIGITQHNDGPNGAKRLICEVCITRLRDACNFKKQVVDSEKRFIDMLGRGEFRPKVVIYQPQGPMKVESAEETAEDVLAGDIEYLEDMDFGGDEEEIKTEALQSTSAAIVTEATPQPRPKRGRPKKEEDRSDKVKKQKISKDVKTRQYKGTECVSMRRRRNLQILFNNTSIIPFKWRGKYLCFYCSKDVAEYAELRNHTKLHGECSVLDHSLKALKGGTNMEVKIDVSNLSCSCGVVAENLDDVIKHLETKHHLEYDRDVDMAIEEYRLVDLNCLICEEKFSYFGYLVSHVNTNHPKNCLICDKCHQKFNKKRDLFSHMKNYHREGGYACELCPQTFSSLNMLRKHRINRHMTRCHICQLRLPSAALRQKHIDLEHPDDGSLQCDACEKEFRTKQGLRMHARKCKGDLFELSTKMEDYNMDLDLNYQDPLKKPSVKQIRQNIITVINMSTAIPFNFYKNKFNCFYCSKDFPDSDSMKEHTVVEHPVCDVKEKCIRKCRESVACVKIDVSNLACKICFENLPNLDNLLDHLIAKHDANYDRSITTCLQPYRLAKDNMTCPNCPGEVFRFFGTLLKHMNKKHTDNNIICVYCGETFRRDQNLRVHVWRHHRDGRFKCSICGAECKIPSRLYMHMAKCHGVKAAKCPKCPEAFSTQYLRQKHLIEAHNSGHKCSYCGKLFTRNSFMRDHIRRTHLKEKNAECSVCNMKFFNNVLLRRHMVKHSGEKNFHCDVCGERFFWRKSLRTHMSRHTKHLDSIHDKPEPNLVPQVVSIQQRKKNLEILFNHTTVVPFKRRQLILCFFCGVPKKTRQELIDHNQTHLPCSMEHESLEGLKGTEFIITADVSEVRCKICQKEFQNIEYLEFHMAQKHELPYALNAKIKFIQLRLIDLKYTVCHDDLQNSEALVKNTHKEHTVSCLECNDCGKQLGVKDRLKCSHKDVYSCYKYSKNVKSRTDYANHRRRDQTLHCILCGKAFASMEMCIRHVKTGHDIANGGTCRFCCKKLDSKDGLVGHVKICSLQKTKPEVVEIRPVSNIIALRDAKQNTRKTIAYIFNSTTLRPFKTYHNRFRCFYCEEESSSCNDIRKHTIAEHPVCDVNLKAMELKGLGRKFWIKVDTSVLDCKLCQSRFDDWKSLIAHLETGHGAKLDGCLEKFHPFKLIEEKYPCPGCGREFSFFPHLLNHFNKEHTLKRHLCGYCGETLHSLASLNYHMSLKHMSTDRYKCSQCGSGFHTRGLLMKHQGSAHGTKVFKCGHCDELFVNEYLRRRHEITKHGGGHQCKHCGVTFVTHYLKTCHVKRRHLMEKNEKCGICDKTFYNKVRLGVHMAVHIGKKNFACQYCEKRFSWKKGLMSHMKVHKVNVSLMPNAISQ